MGETVNQINQMLNMASPCQALGIEPEADSSLYQEIMTSHPTLEVVSHQGRTLADSLEARLETLEEQFFAQLTAEIAKKGITLSHRLHIALSLEGELLVEGEEKESLAVREIMTASPFLSRRFKTLAQLSMLAYGVDVLAKVNEAMHQEDDGEIFSRFHAYIKGPLSHFCVK